MAQQKESTADDGEEDNPLFAETGREAGADPVSPGRDARYLGEDTGSGPAPRTVGGREQMKDWDSDEGSQDSAAGEEDPVAGISLDEMRGNVGELVSAADGLTLHWQRKELDSVPPQLWKIPIYGNLAYLYLEGNTIETLPEELAGFTKLQLLSVSQNRLTVLPHWIASLQSLNTIVAVANRVDTIPAEIGHLTALQTLNLFDNRLERIPVSLGDCRGLKILNLQRNPLPAREERSGEDNHAATVFLPRSIVAHVREGRVRRVIDEGLPFLQAQRRAFVEEEARKEREKDEDAEKLRRHSIREEQLAKARAYQEMTDEEKDRADREAMQATLAARREARAPAESAGSALNASS